MRRAFFSRATTPLMRGLIVATAMLATLGVLAAGCSLGNVHHDDCTTDAQCGALFGVGSTCAEGFCSDAAACATGHDCRKAAGGGACIAGACQAAFPKDATCNAITEPPDLLTKPLAGVGAPLIIGGIMSFDEPKHQARAVAIRLAVADINANGGMNRNQKLGVVFCDNGGPGNTATGVDRTARTNHAVDYLAGTLGVPVIVDPTGSTDSIDIITRLKERAYPTAIVASAATSPALTDVDDRLKPTDKYGLFWRTCPSDIGQGKVLAQQVIPKATGKIAITYLKDAYGEGLAAVFRDTYGITQTESFPLTSDDLTSASSLAANAAAVDASGAGGVLVIALQASSVVKIITSMAMKPIAAKPFFLTDSAKDSASLLDPTLPMAVKTILAGALGTAPASPSGPNYEQLKINLKLMKVDPSSFSFVAHSYDATMVGAFGIIVASKSGTTYDGVNVADGLAHLSAGKAVDISPTGWLSGVGELTSKGQINVNGTSGKLDFDPTTGEAPGQIEVWQVSPDFKSFATVQILDP